ncbi:MAG: hypothetical protein ACT4PI_10615 [Actinomycetota bacterium]
MADIDNAVQALLDFFTNKDDTAANAARNAGGVEGYADNTGITMCDWGDLVKAADPYLTSNQRAALEATTVNNQGANVNVGGQSFAGLPPTANNAQRLAQATVINNETTNNVTTYDNDVANTLNQVATGGGVNVANIDQQIASGPGSVAVGGDVRDSALATGTGSVAGSGAADVIGNVGDDSTVIQDSGLAGVNFGDGPTGPVTGAAPGGVAAGPGGAASGTGPAAAGGSQAAGENIAGVAGGGVQDNSLGGNAQAGDLPTNVGPGQVAGGEIDQSADDIVIADDSVVAQDQSAAAGIDTGSEDTDIA